MAREFVIPNVGEGVTSVEIAAINVSEGDVIEAGTVVAEVETDKAAADVEIDFGGKVLKVHVSAGDALDVGSLLLTIEESADAVVDSPENATGDNSSNQDAADDSSPPVESSPAKPAKSVADVAADTSESPVETSAESPVVPKRAKLVQKVSPVSSDHDDRSPAPAGPATRRLARQLGVDLYKVTGSSAGGRITAEDVKDFVRQTMETGRASDDAASLNPPPLPDLAKWGPIERRPLNKIARSAAANLSMCWNVIPHVTQHELVDITELEAVRRRYAETAKKNGTPKITMTAIAMKAAVVCLNEMPKFNSSLDPQTNELVFRKYFHIACAVDTPNGLLVPVIRDCDAKSISQIAESLADAAGRARDRKLAMDEMRGACFTITNLGGIGGTAFTPIVNYPEVAILGLSRGRKELSIHDGEIEERLMLPLSLSYDHRVINGADAARFVVRFGELLSDGFNLTAHC